MTRRELFSYVIQLMEGKKLLPGINLNLDQQKAILAAFDDHGCLVWERLVDIFDEFRTQKVKGFEDPPGRSAEFIKNLKKEFDGIATVTRTTQIVYVMER